MGRKQVWILEDAKGDQFVFQEMLNEEFDLNFFETVKGFISAFKLAEVKPDLIIADLNLKDGNFIQTFSDGDCKLFEQIPLFVVSSTDDPEILTICFDGGAIEYITKPFNKNELLVKLNRAFSRSKNGERRSDQIVIAGDFVLDLSTMKVFDNEGKATTQLTAREMQILSVLSEDFNQATHRKEITKKVWHNVCVGAKTLDVHIHNLRNKLEPLGLEIVFISPDSFKLKFD